MSWFVALKPSNGLMLSTVRSLCIANHWTASSLSLRVQVPHEFFELKILVWCHRDSLPYAVYKAILAYIQYCSWKQPVLRILLPICDRALFSWAHTYVVKVAAWKQVLILPMWCQC